MASDDRSREARDRGVRSVLWVELLLNLLVATAKGVIGFLTGSLAIAADSVHSFIDGGANLIGLLVLRHATEPPDPGHPYGHRKFEILAATGLGLAMAAAGANLAIRAIDGLVSGRPSPAPSLLPMLVVFGTLCVNIFVATYESRAARRLGSKFLAADAAHTTSDVLVTTAVLASYGSASLGIWWGDSAGSLIVVLVIARVAYGVLRDNLSVLLDGRVIEADLLRSTVMKVEGVRGCHRIRSHGLPDAVIVDLHLLLDGDLTLRASHTLAHRVEEALMDAHPDIVDVTIHVEPEDELPEPL